MSDQPLDDLSARLEREREHADRLYNDALTAVDRAVRMPPVLPDPPKPLDAPRFAAPDLAGSNGARGLQAVIGGIRAVLWRILGSPPGLREVEQRSGAALAGYAVRHAAAQHELHETLVALLETARDQFNALASFESLLVQYLQTITLYVDTKNRSLGGSELRSRVALIEQRLMGIKRDLDVRAAEDPAEPASSSASLEAFAGTVGSASYVGFEDRFRGPREEIARRVEDYVPLLTGASDVVDIGCGRGELLDRLRAHGISARGVDSNPAMADLVKRYGNV